MSRRSRNAVADTLPGLLPDAFAASFPGFSEDAPLDLPPLSRLNEAQITDLLVSKDFDAWSEALARVGNCSRPIRLHGQSQTVNAATGEILSS